MTNANRNSITIKGICEGLKDGSFCNSEEVKLLVAMDISKSLARIADSLETLASDLTD